MILTLIKKSIASQRTLFLMAIKAINHSLRRLTFYTHKAQFYAEWALKPNPEWFDHTLDQYYQWHETQNPLSWERGIYNLLAIKPNAHVLEMCCGDGFNAFHFYSIRSKHITSIDFDRLAIAHAKKHYSRSNIEFKVIDIRQSLPEGPFTNILWDAAIEHFTLEEMDQIFKGIIDRLTPDGILSGYTMIAQEHGLSHDDHEHEFESKQELKSKLLQSFKHVVVFDTDYPTRHNLYFYASNKPLEFLKDFQDSIPTKDRNPIREELASELS